MEMGHAGLVIVKPMDMERPGMSGTNLTALPRAGRGRGAAVGRNFANRQRFAAVLDGGGGLNVGHGGGAPGEWWRVGPMSAGRQGRRFRMVIPDGPD